MTTENKLKELILSQYKSVREFCMANNFAYSTVDNIFRRGILGSSVSVVIKICDRLGIDVDELVNGNIVSKATTQNSAASGVSLGLSGDEISLVLAYRKADDDDKSIVDTALRKYITVDNLKGDSEKMA